MKLIFIIFLYLLPLGSILIDIQQFQQKIININIWKIIVLL